MGRSVNYLRDSDVTYLNVEMDGWDEWKDNLIENLQEKFPSLTVPSQKRWEGNEVEIILDSYLVEVGLSTYGELVSISVRPRDYDTVGNVQGLADQWIRKANFSEKLRKIGYEVLNKVGTFSNGESVYERVRGK